MTRHFRVVWEPEDGTKPWIVQYKGDSRNQWNDVVRFAQYSQAAKHAAETRSRDHALEIGSTPRTK